MTDPYGGREPTAHERHAGQPWDASYTDDEPAPWDVGVQPGVARLIEGGAFRGAVLDAGCGSGEHAVQIAARGHEVVGVDVAATAIETARAKAAERGVNARFEAADALHLERLGRNFDTVLDVGLFHVFDDDERRTYVAGLAAVTAPGARLFLQCFRDSGEEAGPHPVSEATLRGTFASAVGWSITRLAHERIVTHFAPDGLPGWLATIDRSRA